MLQADDIITLAGGRYRLRAPLGGSAYGVVWEASAPAGMPNVAIKLVNRDQMHRAHLSLQGRWITSAETEMAFLRSLAPWDERHIVRLLDSGMHQGLPVMALELMEGDLGRFITAQRAAACMPPFASVLRWIGQLNQALSKVHQYGWSYLDLKPANVLMSAQQGVKLADFGTSRLRTALPAASYAGTASWQAPEQFFPTPDHTYASDERSDFFALGAMFFYLATGGQMLRFCNACARAYRDDPRGAAAALLARHDGCMPSTLSGDEAEVFYKQIACEGGAAAARQALGLLQSLLAPDPEARPQHAMQVSRSLAAIEPLPARAWSMA